MQVRPSVARASAQLAKNKTVAIPTAEAKVTEVNNHDVAGNNFACSCISSIAKCMLLFLLT